MSVKSHTDNQKNSNENENDHAEGVVYYEESDTYECPECGTLKPSREGAEQHCSGESGDEGLSTSSNGEPPEALHEREIWLCWRYEERDGESTKVPIKPYDERDGIRRNVDPEKEGHGEPERGHHYAGSTWMHTWRSYETARNYHENGSVDTEGAGYVFSKEGLLAGVDLDNVRDPDTGEVEPWAKEIINELDSYTELSPSGTGFHIVVFGMKPGDSCRTDMESTLAAFDDAEIEMYEDGRFFTYTGKHVEGTPTTVEQRKASLSEVYNEHLADDSGSVDTAEADHLPKPDLNLSDEKILEKARNAENSEKFTRLRDGDDSYHGNDTSKADKAFCQQLAYWTGGDHNQMDRLFRNSRRMRAKWDEDRGNQTYGEMTIEAALKDQTEFYDPSHVSSSETREGGGEYDTVADALVDEPEEWIDPTEKMITARAAGGMNANEVADCLKNRELPGEASVVKTAGELDSEYQSAFLDFCNDSAGAWTVTTDTGEDSGWRSIRQAYADSDMSNKQARDAAFRRLTEEHSFASLEDTGELLVYNPKKGIYEENGKTLIRSRLNEGLQDQYTKREVSQIVHRIESASSCKRGEFGANETNPQVCVANGVLDLSEIGGGDENVEIAFHEHSPERKFLTRLPVEYDADTNCPKFDTFLDDVLGNETDKQLIYEVLGYCLWPSYPFAKALFLYGDGANGKSTLLDVFTDLLGTENVSSRSMVALEEDRYAKADLYGSFANIAGDLSNQTLKQTGTLKTLTGGDSVTADEKYKQPFTFKNRAKLVFAANDPPKIEDESSALYRRLLLVNFPNEFTPKGQPGPDAKPNHKLMQEIASEEELSGILNKALSALAGVFQRGQFSQNGGAEEVREQYKKISDPVYAFTQDCIKEEQGTTVPKDVVYEAYDDWARENDAPAKDKSILSKELQKKVRTSAGKTTIDNERVRVFKGIRIMKD